MAFFLILPAALLYQLGRCCCSAPSRRASFLSVQWEKLGEGENYAQHVENLIDLGDQLIPFNEDLLCHYLSAIPRNFQDKRFLILSLDRGRFGDFVFGFKTVEILQRQFPGAEVAFTTDSPLRADSVNRRKCLVIKPDGLVGDEISLETLIPSMKQFRPDFLIVAPITTFNQQPLNEAFKEIPSLFIREYGFTDRCVPREGGEYIAGAGADFKGMMICQELVQWAASKESQNALERLKYLQTINSHITKALLGADYSEEAIQSFAAKQELFLGYSQQLEAKWEFMISVAKMMFQYLKSEKTPCFFFMGGVEEGIAGRVHPYKEILNELEIGSIEFFNPMEKEREEVSINPMKSRRLRIVQAPLSPEEVILMLKASEKETLSTGDQSWSEAISADKNWIQENLLHKREALKSVINLAQTIPSFLKGNSTFYSLLAKALRPIPLFGKNPLARCEDQARLLYEARVTPALAEDWSAMNRLITSEHVLEPWIIGMILKKFLATHPPIQSKLEEVVEKKMVPASSVVALLTACYDIVSK